MSSVTTCAAVVIEFFLQVWLRGRLSSRNQSGGIKCRYCYPVFMWPPRSHPHHEMYHHPHSNDDLYPNHGLFPKCWDHIISFPLPDLEFHCCSVVVLLPCHLHTCTHQSAHTRISCILFFALCFGLVMTHAHIVTCRSDYFSLPAYSIIKG